MIKIHNTLTGKLEEFKPLIENQVSMYVCGPTVYNYIHIGNARPAIFFDTVRRYFEYRGYRVKYVQNFTDVDDKMIKRSKEEGITLKEVADKYIKAYFEDTKKVNLKEEGMIRPKATEYIGEMIEIIESLIEKGYAYSVKGDVYFNVEKYKENYGELSKQNTEELSIGARVDINEIKSSPLDFALWKGAKEGEPSWKSPWGQGRPGWHIECSAMSNKLLGPTFDIHGGGQDLIFPHHENEIAQSKCGTGGEFARYWIHNGYINVKGEKMSKSLGNFFLLREVLEKFPGNVVRFFTLSSHYRKPIDFSEVELKQAESGLERIKNVMKRCENISKEGDINGENLHELKNILEKSKIKFIEGMDEDFNTAMGIGAIFELVRELNKSLDVEKVSKNGIKNIEEAQEFIKITLETVLGVELEYNEDDSEITNVLNKLNNIYMELFNENIFKNEDMEIKKTLNTVLEKILKKRREVRTNKEWELSDKIRDELFKCGIKIKDGKDTTQWSI